MTYTINNKQIKNLYEGVWVEGFYIDMYGDDNGELKYTRPYDDKHERKHKSVLNLTTWAKHLHGNAPTGTYYGKYKILLPNGKRVALKIYI